MQFRDGCAAGVLHGVCDRKERHDAVIIDQHDDRLSLSLKGIQTGLQVRRTTSHFFDQPVVAERPGHAIDRAAHAAAGNCFEVIDRQTRKMLHLRGVGDRQ